MENENKNNSQNQANKKNNFYRKKSHRPKGYFLTPNGENKQNTESAENARPAVSATSSPVKKATKPIANPKNTEVQKSKNSRHRHNRNKHKSETMSENINKIQSRNNSAPEAARTISVNKEANEPNNSIFEEPKFMEKLEPMPKKMAKFSNSPEYSKYSDYEEFTYDELYSDEKISKPPVSDSTDGASANEEASQDMSGVVEVVGIRFKAGGKTYYFEPCGIKLSIGQFAIVKTARGLEYGEVALENTFVKESDTVPPLRPVVRIATPEDIKHHAENKEKEDEAFRVCNKKIIEHDLDMKLIDAQYTFDNSKLLFYFTSSKRVDFRDLVKNLASIFRTRIELRQIGIRDEAKMVGGLGLCGRPLCCSQFLADFVQVSIKMAKDQNLSLNSSKISGICGRLMCCLRYEYEAYEYEIKRTPPVETLVRTVDGVGTVSEINPIAGTIKVKLNDAVDAPPKSYKREDVTILKKKKETVN